jgi:hypothetical protein
VGGWPSALAPSPSLSRRADHPHRDRQVEAGALLAERSRREVHDDTTSDGGVHDPLESGIDGGDGQPDADLVAGVPPSDNERLEAIRAHADGTMRYYATAFLRETDENRDLMQAYMGITANILALLDGDALDDRSMMREREEVIQQYIEQARSDPYEPGNCSFCGERPVAAWFEGPTVKTFVRSSADVRAEEAWLACAVCFAGRSERPRGVGRARGRATASE